MILLRQAEKQNKPQPQQNVSFTQSQDGFYLENMITPGNSGKQETADFLVNWDYREFLRFTDPTAIKLYLSSWSLGRHSNCDYAYHKRISLDSMSD